MDKYYYFAAQLTVLSLSKTEGLLSIEDFLEEAKKWLTTNDYRILEQLDLDNYQQRSRNVTVSNIYQQELQLRREQAEYRHAKKQNVDFKPFFTPVAYLKEGTPLDRELNLLKLRWNILEEIELGHYSDLTFFIVYLLKLKLLHQVAVYDKKQGQIKFEALCDIRRKQ